MNQANENSKSHLNNNIKEQINQDIQNKIIEIKEETELKYIKQILQLEKEISKSSKNQKSKDKEINYLNNTLLKVGKKIDEALFDLNSVSYDNSDSGCIDRAKSKLQEAKKEIPSSSSCWIFTAYYGSSFHPDVIKMRAFRNYLTLQPGYGVIFKTIDYYYKKAGYLKFGQIIANKLKSESPNVFKVSVKFLSRILLTISHKFIQK
ncbi:MAG TPA: hypothetical protein PLP19_01740 [bacterium]|nr:hypothetical protein [bacterium]HPN42188.1 hypothetical protein [bacterium]